MQVEKLNRSKQLGPKAVPAVPPHAGRPSIAQAVRTTGVRRGAGGALAAGAALCYSIMLAANRASVVTSLMYDIADKTGGFISAVCPDKGQGGVLLGYRVWVSKKKDGMGKHVMTYDGPPVVIGYGKTTLKAFEQNIPQQAVIHNPRVAPRRMANADEAMMFAWVYRENRKYDDSGGVNLGRMVMQP